MPGEQSIPALQKRLDAVTKERDEILRVLEWANKNCLEVFNTSGWTAETLYDKDPPITAPTLYAALRAAYEAEKGEGK